MSGFMSRYETVAANTHHLRACVHVCVRARARACVCACVHARVWIAELPVLTMLLHAPE